MSINSIILAAAVLVIVTKSSASFEQELAIGQIDTTSVCNISVDERSINYFRSRLELSDLNFISFDLFFGLFDVNYTSGTFMPMRWFWTYQTSSGIYPYLRWDVDYDVLSFGLLNVKTLDTTPYIIFNVGKSERKVCHLTLGSLETIHKIAEQLMVLVSRLNEDNKTVTKYAESYWCYLAEAPGVRGTFEYYLGLYLEYPVSFISYNCCQTFYNYTTSKYDYKCLNKQMPKWMQCTIGPYVLGLILFMYFPIALFKFAACISTTEVLDTDENDSEDERKLLSSSKPTGPAICDSDYGWIYLDGTCPKSVFGTFTQLLPSNYPVLYSRIRRFSFVILGPLVIYIKLAIYVKAESKTTQLVIDRGVPTGFLSLLGKTSEDKINSFAPALGGPDVMLAAYFALSFLFIVLPKSCKQFVQSGIRRIGSNKSPLFLSAKDIKFFSKIAVDNEPGYADAVNYFYCSFYMLFRNKFWKKVFEIQKARVSGLKCLKWLACKFVLFCALPLYVIACVTEIFLCIVCYSIPLCSFIVIISRGAIKTITNTICGNRNFSDKRILCRLVSNRLVIGMFSFFVAILSLCFIYVFCLVFLESFVFLSQIIVFCYVAVIVYPDESFGYLFFGVVLLYYIFRLLRGFGVKYLDLLNDVVEITRTMVEQDNYISVFDENLIISNIKITRIKSITLNDKILPMYQDVIQGMNDDGQIRRCRFKDRNSTYGVPRKLFDYVVNRHLPVHQQILKVVFHLTIICVFLVVTLSLAASFFTGPTSGISKMMHVIFILTLGALPRIFEVAMVDSSEHIHRDIKLRRLENTINQYWRDVSENDNTEIPNQCLDNGAIEQRLTNVAGTN